MQPVVTENVLINGFRITYGIYGEGQPIVLIHGTPSSSLIWRNIAPALASAGYKVHLYDLLGYGLSERPWDSAVDTSISGQVPVLESLVQFWKLQKFHLVAHDIGGAVAQRFAIFHPESIQSLTLIDSVSFDSYPSKRTKQQMENGLEKMVCASDENHRQHFKEWLLSAVHNKEKFQSASLPTFLGYISGTIGQGSLFQHQIRHYDPKHTMEIIGRYHELGKLPVKLIWGAEDQWQVTDWARKLQGAIPGSDLSIVDGAGHFSLEDQPEVISKLIIDHLQKNS